MRRDAIVKITSAKGNALGTGFVIEKDKDGVFVATCGHVVNACGEDTVLVDDQEAKVVKNHYDNGLDIAILYLQGVEIEPLNVAYDTQAKKVKVEGFTYFGKDIKKELMFNIGAKHEVEVERQSRKIEIVRLTPKEKITSGYSGSPVICETTGLVVGMVIVEAREEHTNYAISVKHLFEVYDVPSKSQATKSLFVTEVFDTLNHNRLVVLFSQDFTNITENQNRLKVTSQEKFKEGFFHFSVPSFMDDSKAYFKALAKSCGLDETIENPNAWKVAMQEKLKSSPKRVMLFITDLENGSIELDKQFALLVRSLVSEYRNFSALFIGKKELAYLVYGESSLSPLNTAKELFFPDTIEEVDDDLVEQQFMSLGKHRASICKHLKKETLGRHKAWSFNEAINALFWKNLLVKKGKNFAWRDELTKQIGCEVFECDELGD